MVGNPANTNCYIAMKNAPDLDRKQCFTALVRLDQNRALSQLAARPAKPRDGHQEDDHLGQPLGHPVPGRLPRGGRGQERRGASSNDQGWVADTFIPTVQKRGKAIIEARGKSSSAASAANAAIDHVHDWWLGTPDGDWVSMAIPSDGSYGVREGLIYGYPVTCKDRQWSVVQGLDIDDFSRGKMDATATELSEEADAVADLLPG